LIEGLPIGVLKLSDNVRIRSVELALSAYRTRRFWPWDVFVSVLTWAIIVAERSRQRRTIAS
jgi:hypothetical protein